MANREKPDRMKAMRTISFIVYIMISFNVFGQYSTDTIELHIIDSIDPNISIMIDHHIERIDSNDLYGLHDEYILVVIFDIFGGTTWIPEYIIDSIYSTNHLPPDYFAPGYAVVVTNVTRDHPYLQLIKGNASRYYFKHLEYDVILSSNIMLNLDTLSDFHRIVYSPNYDDVPDYQKSNYLYSFQGIWFEHSIKLK